MRHGWLFLFLPLTLNAQPCDLQGKVVKVYDGDTVTVLDSQYTQHKIRLAGIDAPERKQDFGNASRKKLASYVAGKQICVQGKKFDQYGRRVGKLVLDDRDVNLQMVEQGLAWHYKEYQREQSVGDRDLYAAAERAAYANGAGLWSIPDPVAPWDRRATVRGSVTDRSARNNTTSSLAGQTGSAFTCGTKRYCKQMTSCQEAKYFHRECGLNRLDGDSDGVPCEKFCRN